LQSSIDSVSAAHKGYGVLDTLLTGKTIEIVPHLWILTEAMLTSSNDSNTVHPSQPEC